MVPAMAMAHLALGPQALRIRRWAARTPLRVAAMATNSMANNLQVMDNRLAGSQAISIIMRPKLPIRTLIRAKRRLTQR